MALYLENSPLPPLQPTTMPSNAANYAPMSVFLSSCSMNYSLPFPLSRSHSSISALAFRSENLERGRASLAPLSLPRLILKTFPSLHTAGQYPCRFEVLYYVWETTFFIRASSGPRTVVNKVWPNF